MSEIKIYTKNASKLDVDVLVLAVAKNENTPIILGDTLPSKFKKECEESLRILGTDGSKEKIAKIVSAGNVKAKVVAFVGVQSKTPTCEDLRRATGSLTRSLDGAKTVAIAIPHTTPEEAEAITLGALCGDYRFEYYKEDPRTKIETIHIVSELKEKTLTDSIQRAQIIAEGISHVRDMGNETPNFLYPESFAEEVEDYVKGTKIEVEVWDENKLAKEKCGGLCAVGQGSIKPPRLIKMTYAPKKATKHIALVGKGITFDSGGLSLKPSAAMEEMKSDMLGAATVAHTIIACAKLQLPVKITAWLCCAENMPSGTAERPSDVFRIRNGKTVEVLNTDAEGRLVLADGLSLAVEENPDCVIDVATLTGAQIVALGSKYAGVMGCPEIRDEIVAATTVSGEQMWPMPLPEQLLEGMMTPMADIANIGAREGGMLSAGLFLREFVGQTPWAHIDIACPSFNNGSPWGYTPKGATGASLATLVAYIEKQAK